MSIVEDSLLADANEHFKELKKSAKALKKLGIKVNLVRPCGEVSNEHIDVLSFERMEMRKSL